MKQLMLIKIGGGFITHKDQYKTVNRSALDHIAKEMARFCDEYPDIDVILGHGGGSYPHFPAHKHGLNAQKWQPIIDELIFGVAETHHHAHLINSEVVDALQLVDMPALSFSPLSMLWQEDKEVRLFAAPLRSALTHGCVPVLYGDLVLGENGTKIYSTEQVLFECLQEFHNDYEKMIVVYIANVDGVLDATGEIVSELYRASTIGVQNVHSHDISRGIVGKVEAARQAADIADAVYIVGGWQQQALQRLLAGESVGTRVL